MPLALPSIALVLALSLSAGAETIARWTFENNPPADVKDTGVGPSLEADEYNGVGSAVALGFHSSKATDWSTPAGNGSANSFSSNNWSIGDYYQFTLATTNYENIHVSWDQTRSATGPGMFDFAYSLDGTTFTPFFDDFLLAPVSWSNSSSTTNSSFSADLSSLSGLNHAASVTFRIIAAGAPSSASGASRLDNFLVRGSPLTSEVNSLFWDANGVAAGLGGTGSWNGSNWNATGAGDSAVQAYESNRKAVFAGIGGNVVIDIEDVSAGNGLQFDSDQYIISSTNGRTLTLGDTAPNISVSTENHRATITAQIAGVNGFTKIGAGTLRLDGDNSYTGATTITAGILEITRDRSLGATSTSVALNNGTLKVSDSITLHSDRSITGSGTLDIAAARTLTIGGTFNVGVITVTGGGALQLDGPSPTLTGLILDSASSIGSSGSLRINGNIITAHSTAVSTISAPLDLGAFLTTSGNRTVTVSETGSTLAIPSPITLIAPNDNGQAAPIPNNNGRLHKLGSGILELTGDNTGLFGIRLGSAATSSSGNPIPPADGGTLRIGNKTALGTNTFQFNAGTLHIVQALVGINAIVNPITIGASDAIPAVLSGADVEFTGEVQLFKPSVSIQHTLNVNTNVLFSGAFNASSSPSGSSTGLTFGGTGTLTLAAATNTISEEITIDGPTVTLNGSLEASNGVHVKNGVLNGKGALPFGMLTVGDGEGADATFSPGNGIANYPLGSIVLESDAVLRLEIDSWERRSDTILAGGVIDLGEGIARLELTDLGSVLLPVGFQFTLIQNDGFDPVLGHFEGLEHLDQFLVGKNTFEISYGTLFDPADVTLRVVPEPGTATLLLTAAVLLGGMCRTCAKKKALSPENRTQRRCPLYSGSGG